MKKEEFKIAVQNSISMVWMNMVDEQLYRIVGVNKNTFDDENWSDNPIHILYIEEEESGLSVTIKDENVFLCEISLAKKSSHKTRRRSVLNKETAKTDESIPPSSNKISNN
jgi:hypothetical protein